MQRRASGTYEFRKRLPKLLAGKPVPVLLASQFPEIVNLSTQLFKREIVRSLETKDQKEAKRRNYRETVRVTNLIDAAILALQAPAPPSFVALKISEVEAEIFQQLLIADAEERINGDDRRRIQTVADRSKWPNLVPAVPLPAGAAQTSIAGLSPSVMGMTGDHFHVYGELLAELEGEYREAWARSDPSIVRAETRTAFKRRGIPFDESSPEFREVGLAVLKAHVQAYAIMGERQSGRIVEVPLSHQDRGPKLSEALASWKAGGSSGRGKRPAAKTIIEAERAVRSFRELNSDIPLGDITKEHARAFRDALAKTPKAMPNALRDLPLPALLKRDLSGFPLKSTTTVNKLMGLVGGIISQAERDGALDRLTPPFTNPFSKNMLLRSTESDVAREPFDRADLNAIFGSPVYSRQVRPKAGGGEASFWFPMIALLSGMRLDEIAQLRLCDLKRDDETDRWFFDIGRTGNRRTKTLSSIRRVPIHSELTRIGLLRYRQALLVKTPSSEGPLWPHVSHSARWSKWFGRYLRKSVGIDDRRKVFHSFRHTFKRMTRDAGLHEELHDALTGHSSGKSIGRMYGKGFSLSPLVTAIDLLSLPQELSGITWNVTYLEE